MHPQPLGRYAVPAYPTRLEVVAAPALLAGHLPPGWTRRADLAGAVAVLLAANAIVGVPARAADPNPATQRADVLPALPGAGPAVVAPLFEHGEGRGATGCVAVAPPVFLSEQEALQVITEELATRGIKLSEKKVELKGVTTPLYALQPTYDQASRKITMNVNPLEKEPIPLGPAPRADDRRAPGTPLRADAADPEHHVAVEFVSDREFTAPGEMDDKGQMVYSTASVHAPKAVAATLAQHIKAQARDRVFVGTFYDPAVPYRRPTVTDRTDQQAVEQAWKDATAATRTEAQRLLRQQVKDFADWLKAQGAI